VRIKMQTAILRTTVALFALSPFVMTSAQNAGELPDAESILDRFIEVTGGAEAYDDRRSQIVQGTMSIAVAGISGAITVYQEADDFYTSIDLPGVGIVESGVKDGVAWEHSLLQGARIKSGVERAQAVREATLNASVRWRELFPEVETAGMETIDGEDAYQVVMIPEEGGSQSVYFSVNSGLAVRTDMVAASQMGDIPLQVTMADYMEIGGILMPTTMTQSLAGQSIRISFESTEVNVDIPDEQFDLPAAVAALLK